MSGGSGPGRSDWGACVECQHLGVTHAANGPCLSGANGGPLCSCPEFAPGVGV